MTHRSFLERTFFALPLSWRAFFFYPPLSGKEGKHAIYQ
jgi:hypothetical protein